MRAALVAVLLLSACTKEDPSRWKDLFEPGAVTLPAPLRQLRLGMTEAEAAATGYTGRPGSKIERPGAQIAIGWTLPPRRIEAVLVWLRVSSKEAEEALTQKWGAPVVGTTPIRSRVVYWFDPQQHLSVSMHDEPQALLMFSPAMSVEQFLGDRGPQLGIERIPLIGATLDEVGAAYGDELVEGELRLSAISTTASIGTRVRFTVTDGRVAGFSVSAMCDDEAVATALREGILRRFGSGEAAPALRYDGKWIKIDVGRVEPPKP